MVPSIMKEGALEDLVPDERTTVPPPLYTAHGTQIVLPWPTRPRDEPIITLGDGCQTARLAQPDWEAAFHTANSFCAKTLQERLYFRNESGAESTFNKAITSTAESSAEHLGGSVRAAADGGLVGASDLKASVQASLRTGTLYVDGPRFSMDALVDLRRSRPLLSRFSDIYGDYYVSSLRLGADAGVLASSSVKASEANEGLDIKATLHVLWWDVEKSYHQESHTARSWSQFHITAYDTLTGSNVTDASVGKPRQEVGQEYVAKVTSLDSRVRAKMDELGLMENQAVDLEMCRTICASGLVVEITLLPYREVRDYVMVSNEREEI
ncbi:hypothetical protein HFD88_005913 [Aspergillus terreus]|nr:hypothetical protein HFD88_005913 [Aspergillus terreus]